MGIPELSKGLHMGLCHGQIQDKSRKRLLIGQKVRSRLWNSILSVVDFAKTGMIKVVKEHAHRAEDRKCLFPDVMADTVFQMTILEKLEI